MSVLFVLLTIVFIVLSAAMILIILVQRPQGGGLAGAFGGAGGTSSETVFGGRVGDALTVATVIAFVVWLGFAISLNLISPRDMPAAPETTLTSGESGTVPIDPADTSDPGTTDPGVFDPTGSPSTPPASPPSTPPVNPGSDDTGSGE